MFALKVFIKSITCWILLRMTAVRFTIGSIISICGYSYYNLFLGQRLLIYTLLFSILLALYLENVFYIRNSVSNYKKLYKLNKTFLFTIVFLYIILGSFLIYSVIKILIIINIPFLLKLIPFFKTSLFGFIILDLDIMLSKFLVYYTVDMYGLNTDKMDLANILNPQTSPSPGASGSNAGTGGPGGSGGNGGPGPVGGENAFAGIETNDDSEFKAKKTRLLENLMHQEEHNLKNRRDFTIYSKHFPEECQRISDENKEFLHDLFRHNDTKYKIIELKCGEERIAHIKAKDTSGRPLATISLMNAIKEKTLPL